MAAAGSNINHGGVVAVTHCSAPDVKSCELIVGTTLRREIVLGSRRITPTDGKESALIPFTQRRRQLRPTVAQKILVAPVLPGLYI